MTASGQAAEPEDAASARRFRQGAISTVVLTVLAIGVLMAVPGLSSVGRRLSDI
ncbi:MAG: hypothetical protein QOC95_1339, partial [Thermoleophilaceae bacterium]|nr:hypothetical protein [Thermoleophilaceae bacterium]